MPIPYLLIILLYVFVAVILASDASLVSFNLIAAFPTLRSTHWR